MLKITNWIFKARKQLIWKLCKGRDYFQISTLVEKIFNHFHSHNNEVFEYTHNWNKPRKSFSISLIIRDLWIKTTGKLYLTSRKKIQKQPDFNKFWRTTVTVILCTLWEWKMVRVLKTVRKEILYDLVIPLLMHIQIKLFQCIREAYALLCLL